MTPLSTIPYTQSQNALSLIGRILVALLFVPAGWGKLVGFAGTVGYIASKGVPLPDVCAAIAVAAELGLGLMLLVGWQARWAALGLALFTVVITFIFHNFWSAPAAEMEAQQLNFVKNMAISGGLFAFAALGAGGWSLDGRRRG